MAFNKQTEIYIHLKIKNLKNQLWTDSSFFNMDSDSSFALINEQKKAFKNFLKIRNVAVIRNV